MKEDSIDVLFMGSSNCMTAFSPQEIYNKYGIRSYNLGSDQQSLIITYYWLKEALRYQKPKVVVLDVLMCFQHDSADQPLNCKETYLRKAIDYMRLSPVKMEAIAAICDNDESQNLSSFYFLNMRYHSRWTALNEGDFTLDEWNDYNMKGYFLYKNYCNNRKYKPFDINDHEKDDFEEPEEMLSLMQEYLDKIVALCEENGITFFLVKTPRDNWDVQRYNVILDYANEHKLDYYDFNEKKLYEDIGYDFAVDNNDTSHVNHWGSQKISDKVSELLIEKYGVQKVNDKQWEESNEYYGYMEQNAELVHITEIYEYLQAINKERYSIFMAVKEDCGTYLNEEINGLFQQLGLNVDLADYPQSGYYAIIDNGKVVEEVGEELLIANGSIKNGRYTYSIISAGLDCGNDCSIKINGSEHAKRRTGLNIVVYDNEVSKVIDSVYFNFEDELVLRS